MRHKIELQGSGLAGSGEMRFEPSDGDKTKTTAACWEMSALCVSTRQPSLKALFVSPVILGRWSEGLKAKEDDGPGLAPLASGFQLLRFLA